MGPENGMGQQRRAHLEPGSQPSKNKGSSAGVRELRQKGCYWDLKLQICNGPSEMSQFLQKASGRSRSEMRESGNSGTRLLKTPYRHITHTDAEASHDPSEVEKRRSQFPSLLTNRREGPGMVPNHILSKPQTGSHKYHCCIYHLGYYVFMQKNTEECGLHTKISVHCLYL